MRLSELEKFYQLGNIEGLAFCDFNGVLIEDQTVSSGELAKLLAQSFGSIHGGLRKAGRNCKGLIVRYSSFQFLSVEVPTGVVILQLRANESVNETFKLASSMAQAKDSAAPAAAAATATAQQQPAQAAAQPANNSAEWLAFQTRLTKALARVAPSNLVRSMLTKALAANGVLEGNVPPATIFPAIAKSAMEMIPNKARRTLLLKELPTILDPN